MRHMAVYSGATWRIRWICAQLLEYGIWNISHRDVSVRCWWDKGMILQDIAKTSTFFDQVTTEGFAETMGSGVFGKWFTQYGACHYHCCLYNLLVRVVYVCCVEELQCRCIVKV